MTRQGRDHEMESVAESLRRELIGRIGSERFDLWFGRFGSPRLVADELQVIAPDRFSLERIRRQFDAELRSVSSTLGSAHGIRYRVDVPTPLLTSVSSAAPLSPTGDAGDSAGIERNRRPVDPMSAVRVESRSAADSRSSAESPAKPTTVVDELDDYVAGPHNRLAVAGALEVLRKPGSCTPMFVCGPTGSGKSWLLRAIHARVLRERRFRSVSITSEQFTTGFLEALQGRGLPSFRAKHRDTDLLLLDDVQFFSGKRATLVELLATIDRLIADGRQLVVTSNRLPAELTELGPELAARLGSGLVCTVDHPVGEAKRELIRRMATRKELQLEESVLDLLEREIPGDARRISGAIHRLAALRMTGSPIDDPAGLRPHLSDLLQAGPATVGMHEIEEAVCETFGIDRATLRSSSKTRQSSQPRMLAMFLARRMTRAALSEIGDYFGGRRHSTVATAQRTVEQWMADDRTVGSMSRTLRVSEAIRRIERRLRCG